MLKIAAILLACAPAIGAQFLKVPAQTGTGFVPPRVLHQVEADYPAQARSKGIEGDSTLFTEISKDGLPINPRVLKSLDPELDARALQALRQWRFRPATKDGKPVAATANIAFRFRLSKFSLFRDLTLEVEQPDEKGEAFWFDP